MPPELPPLTDDERQTYEWQLWVRGFGEEGQRKLKASTALVTRLGGLGGVVATQLAAAGVGRLILAHGGNLKPSDLNRQTLMTHDHLGKPRIDSAARRLRELNPRLEIRAVEENVSPQNADSLVAQADIVFDCAPLFSERYALNRAVVAAKKPMIDAAVFNLEGQIATIIPGETACLACLYPEEPAAWKRQFPIFGAVASTAASIAAMEGIKLLTGLGTTLAGQMLYFDLGNMRFDRLPAPRRADCAVCGHLPATPSISENP
ncbi:MAG: HesA/MoeB/ThiF family protein [Planctomycetota bacterium]|nr:HesA/MoeB/ThiF family protein [Planctomycetota bacterium]